MPIKIIVIYGKPDDEAAFMRHYNAVHLPLVSRLPALQSVEVSRVTDQVPPGGTTFLIAEMTFKDREDYDRAAQSPEYGAIDSDLSGFAAGLVTLLVVEGAPTP